MKRLSTLLFGVVDTLLSAYQQYLLSRERARERARRAEHILKLEHDARQIRKASRW